jgi:peptidoglycan/xylan/chitin deacetylase (PgdA/CDA1 family)
MIFPIQQITRAQLSADESTTKNCVCVLPKTNMTVAPTFQLASTNSTHRILGGCVVFRIDDIQDYWIEQAQLAIMDLFLSKNQSLSLGLIMNIVGNDSKIINKLREGYQKGLFELDLHGWNHVDYTKLNEQKQRDTLQMANEKMRYLFGKASRIFIPPLDPFNNDTLKAMRQDGIQIISSLENDPPDNLIWSIADGKTYHNNTIYHIPGTILFKGWDVQNRTWIKRPINELLSALSANIEKYGYAVLVLHPQDFAKLVNGVRVDILDQSEIKDLSTLVNFLLSKNIHILSFSKLISQCGTTA